MSILFFLILIYHKQYRITGPQYGGGGGGGVKKNIRAMEN